MLPAAANGMSELGEKQHRNTDRIRKQTLNYDCAYKEYLEVERDLRMARQWAEKLQAEKQQLRLELDAYEQQRQEALCALNNYQQRVQANEQQLNKQLQTLQQQNECFSEQLQQLQEEHSACAAAKAAGFQAAQECDRLSAELSAAQALLQQTQQQMAKLQQHSITVESPGTGTPGEQQQQQQQQQQPRAGRGNIFSWVWPAVGAASVAAAAAIALPSHEPALAQQDLQKQVSTEAPPAPAATALEAPPARQHTAQAAEAQATAEAAAAVGASLDQAPLQAVARRPPPPSQLPPAATGAGAAAAAAAAADSCVDARPSSARDTLAQRKAAAAVPLRTGPGGVNKRVIDKRGRPRGVAAVAHAVLRAPTDWLCGLYSKLEGADLTDSSFGFAA